MKITVVTPTYDGRSSNWPKLSEWAKEAGAEWHTVRSPEDVLPCPADREWRLPGATVAGQNICYQKLNYWLDVAGAQEGYIHFLADDELVQRGAYRSLGGAPLTILEALRGHATPYRGGNRHDTRPLLADPAFMQAGSVTLGQLIVDASLLRGRRFEEDREDADGRFIQQLVSECGATYRPDLKLYFNALEPGRWNYLEGDMDYCRVCKESALVKVEGLWYRCLGCAALCSPGKSTAFESTDAPDLAQIGGWFRDYKSTVQGNDFLDVGWTDSVLNTMHEGGWAVHGYSPAARGREGCTTVAPYFTAGCFRRQFHGLLLRGVLEHVEDWSRLLQQVHATIIHRGLLMLTTARPWTGIPADPHALQVLSPALVRYHLERLGFEVCDYRLYDVEQQWLARKSN